MNYIVLAKPGGTNLPDEKTDSQGKNVDHSCRFSANSNP
jgi:hypothetical protein